LLSEKPEIMKGVRKRERGVLGSNPSGITSKKARSLENKRFQGFFVGIRGQFWGQFINKEFGGSYQEHSKIH
jgi:hypothetical protein